MNFWGEKNMDNNPNNFYGSGNNTGDFQGLEQTYGSDSASEYNNHNDTSYSSAYNSSRQIPGVNYNQGVQQPYQQVQNAPYNYNPYSQGSYNTPASPYPPFQQPYQNTGYVNNIQYGMPMMVPVNNTPGFALGICSIIFSELPFVGLICSVVGLILSIKAKSDSNKPGNIQGNLITPGIVCSIIGLILSLFVTIVLAIGIIAAINEAADSLDDFGGYDEYGYYDDYNWGGGEAT